MFRSSPSKRFWSILLTSLLCILGIGTFTVANAQSSIPNILAINQPFDDNLDQLSKVPRELEQIDSPLGEDSRVVIGPDDRFPVLSRQYPWSTMGRLEWRDRGQITSTCTATLIGPDTILTNSHCLTYSRYNSDSQSFDSYFIEAGRYSQLLSQDNGQSKMVFKASMINGESLDEADVISYSAGWTSEYQSPVDDWAVLKLDKPLGDYYGYMGWRSLDFTNSTVLNEATERIHLLGYAGDFPAPALREWGNPAETAGVDLACSVVGVWPVGTPYADTLAHDCDTNPGASGGPIFAKFNDNHYYLVGLHARSTQLASPITLPNGVTTEVINGGVQLSRWQEAAQRARN